MQSSFFPSLPFLAPEKKINLLATTYDCSILATKMNCPISWFVITHPEEMRAEMRVESLKIALKKKAT